MSHESKKLVLVINPGSTSTKVALFEGENETVSKTLKHSSEKLGSFNRLTDQFSFRLEVIQSFLKEQNIEPSELSAVSARGGLTRPISGGVYRINKKMIDDLKSGRWGEHPCNLGAPLGAEIAAKAGCPAFIVDPPIVDELGPPARFTGHPEFERKSVFHALSQKAAAWRAARELDSRYEQENFIVVHMGGGISVGAHKKGRVVDVNNALDGDGPFSPERSGTLPAGDLARLCFSKKYQLAEVLKMITGKGGLLAYLGTNDGLEIEKKIEQGDEKFKAAYHALAYQVSKEVGSMAAVLAGEVTAVVVTGGLSVSDILTDTIKTHVSFIAPVKVYPELEEMGALATGALAALNKSVSIKEYD